MSADAGTQLERALRRALAGFAVTVEMEELASRPWASITFTGARHRLVVRIGGERAETAVGDLVEGLGEREFVLRGHILADLVLAGQVRDGDAIRLTLEALTVEAC